MVDALIPKDSKAVLSAASVFKTRGMMERPISRVSDHSAMTKWK
jgi:hypothetical protein